MASLSHAAGASASDAARGITCMLVATLIFALYGALTKWLGAGYSPLQIIFFRGLFGLIPLAVLLRRHGGLSQAVSRRPGLQLLRAGAALVSNVCFILAYGLMALADAVAIGYAAPLIVTALAGPLLGERVGIHRWSAVIVGFAGVLTIAQPNGAGLEAGALLAFAGTLLYALALIATRRLGDHDSAVCTMTWSTSAYVVGTGLALPFVWVTPGWADLGLFAALGLLGGCGMFLLVEAYRLAPASTVTPFDYATMGWAALLGFLVWGEIPGTDTTVGVGIILAAGAYILHRESLGRRRATAALRQSGHSPGF